MALKSKSGKPALVFNVTKGTLIEGDGTTPLANDSWFMVDAYAETSELPLEDSNGTTGRVFKSPDSANDITPAEGDNVYPLTLTRVCKGDASISTEKGTIDVTDDCEAGYNAYIVDGYSDISGSISSFLKFDESDQSLSDSQEGFLGRFFDIATDDGAGAYTLTTKSDADILLFILQNGDVAAESSVQQWLIIPAILSGTTTDKPLKGVQNLDLDWTKAQGPASVYQRITNASETVY